MDYRTARNAALCVGLLVCLGLSSQEAAAQGCPADLNSDNVVDAADLAMLLGSWGPGPGAPADFNGDDIVNAADLAVLLGSWGACVLDTGMDAWCSGSIRTWACAIASPISEATRCSRFSS